MNQDHALRHKKKTAELLLSLLTVFLKSEFEAEMILNNFHCSPFSAGETDPVHDCFYAPVQNHADGNADDAQSHDCSEEIGEYDS